ncbi:MAG: hypothetical protein AAFP02_10730 [Bacteroidota bacterium]
MADDLLQDPESPVAPMLQILLSKMWQAAKSKAGEAVIFDQTLYRQFQQNGLGMEDFLHQQLKSLEQTVPEQINSGLVVDLLAFHTTALGTATKRKLAELEQAYSINGQKLAALLTELKKRYLLIDPKDNQTTRLAHDTLAPLVQKRFDESNAAGQQATRVIRNQLVLNRESPRPRPLDRDDLKLVDQGQEGRRRPTQNELYLYLCSKVLKDRLGHQRKQSQALRAHQIRQELLSRQAVQQAYHHSQFYQLSDEELGVLSVSFSPQQPYMLIGYAERDAVLCDLEGNVLRSIPQSHNLIQIRWNRAGTEALLLQDEGQLSWWNLEEMKAQGIELSPKLEVEGGRGRYARKGGGGKGGRQKSRFLLHDFAFSADEEHFLIWHPEAGPQLYDREGKLAKQQTNKFEQLDFGLLLPEINQFFVVLDQGGFYQAHLELERYHDWEFAVNDEIQDGYWDAQREEIILLTRKTVYRVPTNLQAKVEVILQIEKGQSIAPTPRDGEYLFSDAVNIFCNQRTFYL